MVDPAATAICIPMMTRMLGRMIKTITRMGMKLMQLLGDEKMNEKK